MKQSDRASPRTSFVEQSDRAPPSSVSTS